MIPLQPTTLTIDEPSSSTQRSFWYQNQYAIANPHGSPQEYVRGRIVRKLGDEFYIKPFGKEDSIPVHYTKVEFFSEDGKRRLTKKQIKAILKEGGQL